MFHQAGFSLELTRAYGLSSIDNWDTLTAKQGEELNDEARHDEIFPTYGGLINWPEKVNPYTLHIAPMPRELWTNKTSLDSHPIPPAS